MIFIKSIRFQFLNSSRNLVADFREMGNSIGIKTGMVCDPFSRVDDRTGNESINCSAGIDAKDQVKEFISIIESNKWFSKWNKIGEKLMTLYSNTRNIQEAIDEAFRYKRNLYTKKNTEDLRSLVLKHGGYRPTIRFMRNNNYNLIPPKSS